MRTRLGGTLLLTSVCWVQTSEPAVAEKLATMRVLRPPAPPAAVTGKPYSGQMEGESNSVAREGTRYRSAGTGQPEYRDSLGRTRREQAIGKDTRRQWLLVTIDDPAAGFEYVLDPRGKIAHRFNLSDPPRQYRIPWCPSRKSRSRPNR